MYLGQKVRIDTGKDLVYGAVASSGNCRKRKNCLIQTLLSTSGPETGEGGQKACACGVRCGV